MASKWPLCYNPIFQSIIQPLALLPGRGRFLRLCYALYSSKLHFSCGENLPLFAVRSYRFLRGSMSRPWRTPSGYSGESGLQDVAECRWNQGKREARHKCGNTGGLFVNK